MKQHSQAASSMGEKSALKKEPFGSYAAPGSDSEGEARKMVKSNRQKAGMEPTAAQRREMARLTEQIKGLEGKFSGDLQNMMGELTSLKGNAARMTSLQKGMAPVQESQLDDDSD
jgi:hypothetical protein